MKTSFQVTEQQWQAISAPLAPAVVIAGAGSGKTSLMTARVIYLVANKLVSAEQILGLTFTTKAAAELRSRVQRALALADLRQGIDEILEPTITTYNAYAAGLLRTHGLRIGVEPDNQVLADASRYQLAAKVIRKYSGQVRELSDHPETVIRDLLQLDATLSEHLVSPESVLAFDTAQISGFNQAIDIEKSEKNRKSYLEKPKKALNVLQRRKELLGLVTEYRQAKKAAGVIDFSDQIAFSAKLVENYPQVSDAEREKFKVVLLDEYQDTSTAQAILLQNLFSGESGHGLGHPVTAVGDPNQAIYGWRGASVENILEFDQQFLNSDGSKAQRYFLNVSQRSAPEILSVANEIAVDLTTTSVQLAARSDADSGQVDLTIHDTVFTEAAVTAAQIKSYHTLGLAWSDIAVLVRDNKHAAVVYDELTKAEIPVEIVGVAGLLKLPEVAMTLATLQLLHDVTSNDALLTLLTSPRWKIGPRDLALLGNRASELAGTKHTPGAVELEVTAELAAAVQGSDPIEVPCLTDALADPGEANYDPIAKRRFLQLDQELNYLRQYLNEPLLDLVKRVVDLSQLDIELASLTNPAASARRENLQLFIRTVAEFSGLNKDTSLNSLLAYFLAEEEFGGGLEQANPTNADSVKLLTVHRAKGLEWAAVFVLGMAGGRFPTETARPVWVTSPAVLPAPLRGDANGLPQLSGFDKAAIEAYQAQNKSHDLVEEVRLAYVAVTRAAKYLHLSSFTWWEKQKPNKPSKFLTQIAPKLLANQQLSPDWAAMQDCDRPAALDPTAAPWPNYQPVSAQLATWATAIASGEVPCTEKLSPAESQLVNLWDTELAKLVPQPKDQHRMVQLPSNLSATELANLAANPDKFLLDLVRPMPKPPAGAARIGSRFHDWVEHRFGQINLLDVAEISVISEVGTAADSDLAELIQKFEASQFAARTPIAIEAPFSYVLGSQVIRGRIDAVYQQPDGSQLIIDWKTNRQQTADPVQLSLYRQAWAELANLDQSLVTAAFYYVRDDQLVFPDLLSRTELTNIIQLDQSFNQED